MFAETHCAGHQCWHLRHPDTVREHEQATLFGDVVGETYRARRRVLARHVELAGPDAIVVVVLHTGMRHVAGANDLLGGIVAELGGPYRACEYRVPSARSGSTCTGATPVVSSAAPKPTR